MNTEWQQFLTQQGASLPSHEQPSVTEHPQQLVTGENMLCDLSHIGLISISGDDAQQFLHAQFTNDVNQVSASKSQLNAYCSAKGRVLANFRLFMRDGTYYLAIPQDILGTVLNRLKMFVLRSQVVLNDASDELIRIGVAGQESTDFLHTLFSQLPESINDVVQQNSITLIRIHGSTARYEIYGQITDVIPLWKTLAAQLPVGSPQDWQRMDIAAGIPSITASLSDAYVPQMLNLDVIDAVNFKKGCYPGQEVVARTQYLGKLKRRLFRAHIETCINLPPGTSIFASNEAEQVVGKVINAACYDCHTEFLAVIQIDSAIPATLTLESATGPQVTILELPYSIGDNSAK